MCNQNAAVGCGAAPLQPTSTRSEGVSTDTASIAEEVRRCRDGSTIIDMVQCSAPTRRLRSEARGTQFGGPRRGSDARQDPDGSARIAADQHGPVWTLPKQPITPGP